MLAVGAGGPLDALTVNRLNRLCQGDLRLLRDLFGAVRERGLLTRATDSDEWAWRGPVPVTATVRERTAQVLDHTGPEEREILERLAFAEPLASSLDDFDLDVLERLETEALVHVDDQGGVRLAHPLHGPALRAAAGRLRARRLARTPDQCAPALAAERAALSDRIDRTDVRPLPTPVGSGWSRRAHRFRPRTPPSAPGSRGCGVSCARRLPGRAKDCGRPRATGPARPNSPWPQPSRATCRPPTRR